MSKQRSTGGMGMHKHRTSGRSGPPSAVKRSTADFMNKEEERKKKRPKPRMYESVKEAIEGERR